jgi:hypothetical protein
VDVSATTLSSTTSQTPIFTAPVAGGTYRIGCTVTDSTGVAFSSAIHIYVATRSLVLTTPATADDPATSNSLFSSSAISSQYTVFFPNLDLPHARNLQVRVTDANDDAAGTFSIAVDGIGADGHYQTEYFTFTSPGLDASGGVTLPGTKPFARVECVRWVRGATSLTGLSGLYIHLGVGDIFGLPEILPAASSVRQVVLSPATTLATPADYTVVASPGSQGVSFTNAANRPNDARSYVIYYDDN